MILREAVFAIGYGRGVAGGGGGGAWIKCPPHGADKTCDYLTTLFPIAMIAIFIPATGLLIWLDTTGRIDEAKDWLKRRLITRAGAPGRKARGSKEKSDKQQGGKAE